MFQSEAYSQFFQEGNQLVTSLISVCFSGKINLKQIEEKTALGGLGHASSSANF